MARVEILKGLPASGKSTYAKAAASPEKIRLNKDELREMLFSSVRTKTSEKVTLWMRDALLKEALRRGIDVIVDDTNLNPIHEKQIRKLSKGHEVDVRFFTAPRDELIRRDNARENSVGKPVIDRMIKQWESWKEVDCTVEDEGAWQPVVNRGDYDAWIVDIDGTLADHTGLRSPYEFWKVGADRPIRPVCRLVHEYLRSGGRVFFFSGRDDSCYEDTKAWLEKHIDYPYLDESYMAWSLHMRKTGDKRKDDIVKSEMFDSIVEPSNFEVSLVIDDRKQVKRMWVARGLFVLDVNQTDEEF